ncbi:hypothetical protein [Pantoea piersonii]|uniref:hypothetical protein n=1 Tax=Pantoea piersonii TaxID=2364647 RepID=UPI0028998AA2|nr:hypothetical protein [Pantoea piersonii]
MTWQGIPFPFAEFLAENHSYLQIDKLPTIIIDSGFPWENVLGSFIAACIPAFIAWKTIKNSNDLIKSQILLSAHQKKIEFLRELFADYLTKLEYAHHSIDILFESFPDEKVPYGELIKVMELSAGAISSSNKILITLGKSHKRYDECRKLMKASEKKIEEAISNPEEGFDGETAVDDEKNKLIGFLSELLEEEEKKLI